MYTILYTMATNSQAARYPLRTIASLRLNIEAAIEGRVCELLPEGFRDNDSARTYPLPSARTELQKLVAIPISPNVNSGNIYLQRALSAFKRKQARRTSAVNDIAFRSQKIAVDSSRLKAQMNELRAEAQSAVDGVKAQAEQAIASLSDLFALGRRGLESQMQAHLSGSQWQGEAISAAAFRDCFRMVTQAVKGLGLPSEQRGKAAEAIMQEVADSLEATREAVAMASPDCETEH